MNDTNSKYSTLLQAARAMKQVARPEVALQHNGWSKQNAPPQTTHLICTLAALGLVLPVDHRWHDPDR